MMEKATHLKAILTQCWECMGYYTDGKQDCENVRCPLYSYMPYRKLEPDLGKFAYNPRSVGRKLKTDTSRPKTEQQRLESARRLAEYRERRKGE